MTDHERIIQVLYTLLPGENKFDLVKNWLTKDQKEILKKFVRVKEVVHVFAKYKNGENCLWLEKVGNDYKYDYYLENRFSSWGGKVDNIKDANEKAQLMITDLPENDYVWLGDFELGENNANEK